MKQFDTERGSVTVSEFFPTERDAKENGYTLAFHSRRARKTFYSKPLDDRGLKQKFALIIER